MGNNQSTSQLEKHPYLAISPYPLVSVMRKPARAALASTAISSSRINIISCARNAGVIENDNFRESGVCTYTGEEESRQQQLMLEEDCQQQKRIDQDGCSYLLCSDQLCELQTCEIGAIPSSQQLECPPSIQIYHILNRIENTSEPLHQHLLNTKAATTHALLDGCNECLTQGKIYDSYNGQHYPREIKFIQDIDHTEEGSQLKVIDLTFQLSVTEAALDEMTEADQNLEFRRGVLVERGGICGPPDRRGFECRMTRNCLVKAKNKDGGSGGQTGQCEVVGRSIASNAGNLDNRLPTSSDPHVRNGAFIETRTWETTATNAGNLDNRLPTISDPPVRNDAFSETRTWETTATNAGNLDNRLPTISEPPMRTDTFSSATAGGPQIYIDQITGEYHSMVFGSFAGEETSINHGTNTFSPKRNSSSVVNGNFMNSCGASLGTLCFSNVTSRDSFQNSHSDFEPSGDCRVHAGRVGPFDSFNDDDQMFSGEQVHDAQTVDMPGGQAACGHCNESQNTNLEDLPFSSTCSAQPDIGQESPPRTMSVVSSCQSCDSTGESSSAQRFGNSGFICESCSHLSQSLAADTSSFTAYPSSEFKSKFSHDSWSESYPGSFTTQATGRCFLDYSDDSQDLCNSHDNCDKHSCSGYQNKMRSNINSSRCVGLSGTHMEVEECEIATEDFGIDRNPHSAQPTEMFGQKSYILCSKTIQSQLEAESKIRGTDTGEFNLVHAASSDGMCCPLKTSRSDNSIIRGGNKQHRSDDTNTDFSDELADSKHHSFNLPPNLASFNHSLPAKYCNTEKQEFEENLPEDRHHGRNLTIPSFVDDTIHVDGSDNGYVQNNGTRPKVCNTERQNYMERMDRARLGENGPCLMQQSALISCDCIYPFKQNYVAYLCCAPDDLSKFGLTFHKTLEEWGYRIFIAPRDLELTGPKYENMARWLEERCNGKIIVILSKNYGKSDECLFLTYFARTLDPDARYRNIIPVMIDHGVEIPNILKGLSIIKYNNECRLGWLKRRLAEAIAA